MSVFPAYKTRCGSTITGKARRTQNRTHFAQTEQQLTQSQHTDLAKIASHLAGNGIHVINSICRRLLETTLQCVFFSTPEVPSTAEFMFNGASAAWQ
jgi:hypothetical protein